VRQRARSAQGNVMTAVQRVAPLSGAYGVS